MNDDSSYHYLSRPAYGGGAVIELNTGGSASALTANLAQLLKLNGFTEGKTEFSPGFTECTHEFVSDRGTVELHRDEWDIVFLLADDPQLIQRIEQLLQQDSRFYPA
jgi:hypothetical protein